MKILNVLLVSCLLGAGNLFAQSNRIHLLPANSWDSNDTHQVVWETTPGVRYELQQSGSLTNWTAVDGYPVEASQYVEAYVFNASNESANARFFKVVEYDEQAPTLSNLIPGDGAFAIPRFNSPISLTLADVSGVDPSSISMTVGDLGIFTVSSEELTYTNGVLIFDMGGDIALGPYGATMQVSLVAADMNGYAMTNEWTFDLERETIENGDILVLGSPDAQRAGQQLSASKRMAPTTPAISKQRPTGSWERGDGPSRSSIPSLRCHRGRSGGRRSSSYFQRMPI